MQFFLDIPLFARLVLLFVCGIIFGAILERLSDRLTAPFREIPGTRKPVGLRFVLSGVFLGFLWLGLYWWECVMLGLSIPALDPEPEKLVNARFFVHAILSLFLLAASLIDFDEMIIPDEITVFGTIVGLIIAACLPDSLLPVREFIGYDVNGFEIFSENPVPVSWTSPLANPLPGSIGIVIGIWWFWCFAMMNRFWYTKFGLKKAVLIFLRQLRRSRSTCILIGLGIIGAIIFAVFGNILGTDSPHWKGLETSMIGLFGGAIVIWGVRLIGSLALGREAMGFGDVTLMAMIGTFIGWQGCIVIFFLAPFAGIIFGIARFALRLGKELPYGPFLCLGTLFLILKWPFFWLHLEPLLILGGFVPIAMLVCLILLGLMLAGWNAVRR